VNNYPYEPGPQNPYGPYQPGNQSVPPPPPPPPSYQPISAPSAYPPISSSSPYQTTDQYAPTMPVNPYMSQPPGNPRGPKKTPWIVITTVVILVIAVGSIASVLVAHSVAGNVTPPTPTPVPYPALASAYSGLAHNITYNEDANMVMPSVVQDAGKINGTIQFGLPLVGSGTFNGTVSRAGAIQFTIASTDAGGSLTSTFVGSIDKQKAMSGTYSITNGQKGTWKVSSATSPVLYPLLFANYSGNFNNTATGKSGTMTLTIVTQNQQNFTGEFDASIPIKGTVGTDNSIQFTGADDKGNPVVFTGTVNVDSSLNGTYKAVSGGAGTWKVTPGAK